MLHGRNKRFFFLWEKKFFLMQNIFIVPAMQHGCRAKPLFTLSTQLMKPNYLVILSTDAAPQFVWKLAPSIQKDRGLWEQGLHKMGGKHSTAHVFSSLNQDMVV